MTKGDWIIFLSVLIGIMASLTYWYGTQVKNKEKELMESKTGELESPEVEIEKIINIQLGGFHFMMNYSDIEKGFNFKDYVSIEGFDYPIKLKIVDKKLYVSVKIKNENNDTIAIIEDNEWTVNDNVIIARDRNYNDYAFEVIDANLIPRLQVIFYEDDLIYIGGYIYTSTGSILAVPNITVVKPSQDYLMMAKDYRIFQYPSKENFGKLNPNLKFEKIPQ